jgi:cell division protease FtsH
MQLPLEDKYLTTKTEIVDRLAILLGGRTAESLVFNEITTGAQNDLSKATEIVQKMICEYGMSDTLGPVILRKREEEMFLGRDIMSREKMYSEQTAEVIDHEVKKIIDDSLVRTTAMLKDNRDKLDALATRLIEKEVLDGDEINRLLGMTPEEPAAEPKIETPAEVKPI